MAKIKIAAAQYNLDYFKAGHVDSLKIQDRLEEWKSKIKNWVIEAHQNQCSLALFPEYGSMEITSLFKESERLDLKKQVEAFAPFLNEFLTTFKQLAVDFSMYIVAPSLPVLSNDLERPVNRCFVFSPTGQMDYQDKIHMTRFEDEEWGITEGELDLKVFSTPHFNFSIQICFDIEFSLISQLMSHYGAHLLLAPSCTETVKGSHRVHIGARARALENQNYVVVAQTVGAAEWSPAVDQNYGVAAIYSTPDVGMPPDGIIKIGEPNQPGWIFSEVNISHIEKVRQQGAVFNFKKHKEDRDKNPELFNCLPYRLKKINLI